MIGIFNLITIGIVMYLSLPLLAKLSQWLLVHWTMLRFEILNEGKRIEIDKTTTIRVLKKHGILLFTKELK